MKKGFFKRFLTVLFVTILLVTSLPISTFANEDLKAQDTSFNEFIARDVEVGGETRTSKGAENVAVEFLSQLGSGKSKRVFHDEEIIDLEQVYPEEVSQRSLFSSDDAPELFIFNNADSGFVIVSGDKRATDILGYSDEGSFNYDKAPEYVKDWIGEYENQIQYIRNNPKEFKCVIDEKVLLRDEHGATSQTVAPFLNDIKWDQLDPYNLLAPEYEAGKKSATGCVATAMAQVMKYYNYPTKGVKDTSYDWRNPYTGVVTNLSSDISNHTYDWDNMPKSYIGVTDEAQRQNVAQLMYDAGVAAKMEYGESSGTASLYAGQAFVENFGYDEGLKDLYRSSYSKEDWQNIVREELIEKRPVFYGGSGKSGGHQFILDGYDDNNLYHVNWGWGGMANGYYALDAMNPTSLGTGAAGGTYNMHQEILVGIKPKDENIVDKTIRAENTGKLINYDSKQEVSDLNNGPYTTSKSELLISKWNLFVESLSGFQGEYGLGLEINGEIKLFQTINNMEVGQYGSQQAIIWQNLDYVTDGDYELKMYKKATDETSFSEIPSKTNKSDVIKVRLEGDKVTYYLDDLDSVNLELLDFSRDPGWELYSGSTAKFNANIKNNGNEEYNSLIYIELENKTSGQKYIIGESQIVLSEGETKNFNINDDITYNNNPIPVGEYTAKIIYNKGNTQDEIATGSYEYLGNGIDVEIKEKVLGQMNILENPRFVENTNPKIVSKPSDLNIVVKIKAIGGLVEGSFSAVVAEYGTANELMNFSSKAFRIEKDMEQDIILENSDTSQLVDGKDYWIFMFYGQTQLNEQLIFTYKKVETVDKTALESKITEAESKKKEDYTAESFKVLEDALANAKTVNENDNATQDDVDKALANLTKAVDALVEKEPEPTVDKTALQAKYDEVKDKAKGNYTDDSWNAFETARNAAKTVLDKADATQAEVNTALANLTTVIAGLAEKEPEPTVDKTALQAKYDEVKDKVQDNYTDDSWNSFTTARDSAQAILEKVDATQTEVDDALANLTTAVEGLVEKEPEPTVNKDALQTKYDEVKDKAKDNYTDDSWNAFETAREAAKNILDKVDATQTEVNTALNNLTTAITNLKEKANKTALVEKIADAESKKKEDYTAESFKVLEDALANANTVNENDNATQDEVNNALSNLNTAINGLVAKPVAPTVDKTALQAKYDEVKDKAKDNYTDGSWTVFITARDAAKSVLENDDATQEEVNTALANLNTAVAGLAEKEPEPAVDKTALQAKYDEVKNKAKDNYTDESWNAFETVRNNAKTVLDKADATQTEVDDALSDLNTSIGNLEENEPEPTVDKSKLSEKISEAEKIDEGKYTSSSVANLKDALEKAKITLNDLSASQEEVDTAFRNLNSAIKSLNLKEGKEESSSGSSSSGSWNWAPSKATKEVSKNTVISKEVVSTNDFKDIDNHWAKDIIKYVVEKGYFNGVDKYNFAPNQKATRGEFITVLGRLAKVDVSKYQIAKAKDLNKGVFYEPYVNWAFEVGIVKGYEDGTFRGEDNISREEMAVLLYNTLKYMKVDLGESSNELFKDQDKISDWAIESVNFLKAGEFIKGKEDNKFDPKANLTRAEIAQIIYNVIQK
ncbi:Uncharacterised Sugar-binding Domain [Anaerosphaera aminiphila DSM 21120]|uniref:Streptopain n=1 Tax=Anaerosphaera aminiphila DSM 21120 TaxID=1120995 RepID=A0A1M5Q5Y9_9FIRM|nr:C10 family peptidase [Anaerosphaera aminiphila]SHH08943.1 Uncharacterised Sugar-binding Domain [Anaerosphaera aminiphila DSM 21120]